MVFDVEELALLLLRRDTVPHLMHGMHQIIPGTAKVIFGLGTLLRRLCPLVYGKCVHKRPKA